MLVSVVDGLAIGHIVCARRWHPSMTSTTSFVALSNWSVETRSRGVVGG